MSGAPDAAAPLAPAPPGGGLPRVFRVFTEPVAVFRELATSPTWLAPLLVIGCVSVATQLLLVPRLDFEATVRQGMSERVSQMSDEQVNKAVEVGGKMARYSMYASPLAIPVVYLALAGIYFLGLKAMGSLTEYKPVFSTVVHAALPAAVVSSVLLAVVAMQRGSFAAQELERMVRSSLGAWLPPETSKPLLAIAGVLDIFNVWQWVLLVLGLQIVGGVTRAKAVTLVALVWGVWALGKVGLAALR